MSSCMTRQTAKIRLFLACSWLEERWSADLEGLLRSRSWLRLGGRRCGRGNLVRFASSRADVSCVGVCRKGKGCKKRWVMMRHADAAELATSRPVCPRCSAGMDPSLWPSCGLLLADWAVRLAAARSFRVRSPSVDFPLRAWISVVKASVSREAPGRRRPIGSSLREAVRS